ncbi:MAG: hypothetical protein A2805_02180 [Candidatus Andersenbacteria bacterium RIFCSPHIGHO2_01_FULL_46_36]|uniref:Uncharacterized protein n=1 Tax=Candidatus Andersenbacteria bacterium RIFCSPHIGHO2_12_FULL_45_11 TaxID=1797281 RepID=A0A1G1X1S7_9BACT|nr:MAG: hypothetical protein A2805_02180 [Candidatus Andersenbacteria bacterium RIFCSPHIGHO2_01_FULL_46_36]OGY33966.1 MAG: hypothetical protein A3D99_04070 [Candidatus Andersenbacteria bacterium RIFCSPHIGHO2_12_FULL_45_11]
MSAKKQTIADLLFVVQIIGAVLFCGAQFLRSLVDVRGVSIVQFGLVATYLIFHLALGIGAHRARPSRLTRQAIATYCTWFLLMIAIIGAVLANGSYRWSVQDTTTLLIALVLTLLIIVVGHWYNFTIANPVTKALLAITYKSVPQVLLAWKILAEGGSGIPALTVLVGHLTILIRLGQIYMMVREAGWDPNRKWLGISETANGITWVIATIAWLL